MVERCGPSDKCPSKMCNRSWKDGGTLAGATGAAGDPMEWADNGFDGVDSDGPMLVNDQPTVVAGAYV